MKINAKILYTTILVAFITSLSVMISDIIIHAAAIKKQTAFTFNTMNIQLEESLDAGEHILEDSYNSYKSHMNSLTHNIANRESFKEHYNKRQWSSLINILRHDVKSVHNNIDFAIIYDTEGFPKASFPNEIRKTDARWLFRSRNTKLVFSKNISEKNFTDVKARTFTSTITGGRFKNINPIKEDLLISSAYPILNAKKTSTIGYMVVGGFSKQLRSTLDHFSSSTRLTSLIIRNNKLLQSSGISGTQHDINSDFQRVDLPRGGSLELFKNGPKFRYRSTSILNGRGRVIAKLIIAKSEKQINDYMQSIRNSNDEVRVTIVFVSIFITTFIMLLSTVIARFLSNKISYPITEAIDAASKVANENYDVSVDVKSNDETGDLARALNTMISKMKRHKKINLAQKKNLEESNRKSTNIIQGITSGLIIIDAETHLIMEMNQAASKMIGIKREAAIGRKCHDFICPAKKGCCPITDLNSHMENKEETLITADNRTIPILKTVVPIVIDGKECLLENFVEISQIKETQEQLQIEKERANQMADAKSNFLSNMSHEIRTPMNGIIGMGSLLIETKLDSDQRKFVHTINHSAQALLTVINDVLDFSKIEAGKLDIEQIEFDLHSTIDSVYELLRVSADEKGLDFACMIHHDVPDKIIGDPGRIRQIIINLLSNAIKFTSEGNVSLHLSIDDRSENLYTIKFEVTDTGIGLTDDVISRLFTAFVQADNSTTRRFGGTGLGLSISKKLAEMMGGEIGVRSDHGVGSTFWFTIQVEEQEYTEQDLDTSILQLKDKRFLVVNDDDQARASLLNHILRWTKDAHEAVSDDHALKIIQEADSDGVPFDVVMHDVVSTELKNTRLISNVHALALTKTPHMILLTNGGMRGDASKAESLGFSAYLSRPINPMQLRSCLLKVINADRASGHITTKHSLSSSSSSELKVLLVEDNEINQFVAVKMLTNMGHHTSTANNGKEAVEAFSNNRYGLILMDGQMPVMGGIEATRIIRAKEADENLTRTPIIALTALAMKEDKERFIECGMDAYLTKPLDVALLREAIDRVTTGRAEVVDVKDEAKSLDIELWNKVELLQNFEGMLEGLDTIINMFLNSYSEMMQNLNSALEGGELAEIRFAAHTLKGVLQIIKADKLIVTASQIEHISPEDDITKFKEAYNLLSTDIDLLVTELNNYIDSKE